MAAPEQGPVRKVKATSPKPGFNNTEHDAIPEKHQEISLE